MNQRTSTPTIALQTTTLGGGGTERYVEDLAIGLSGRGARVAVIVDHPPLSRKAAVEKHSIPVIVIGHQCQTDSEYEAKLTQSLTHVDPHILHINAWESRDIIKRTARKLGIQTVTTHHHTTLPIRWRELAGLTRRPLQLYSEAVRAYCERPCILCVSKTSQENLRRRWPLGCEHVRQVYYGVRDYRKAEGTTSSDHSDADGPLVLWSGSMIDRKRPSLALRLFRQVLNHVPAARLEMLGDGPLLGSIRHEARDLQYRVTIPGYVDDIAAKLRSAALLLHTATYEGIPYSAIEALAAGIPVVATAAGAIHEAVIDGENGRVFRASDTSTMAQAIERLLLDNDFRRDMGGKAYAQYQKAFRLDQMITRTIDAYRDICQIPI